MAWQGQCKIRGKRYGSVWKSSKVSPNSMVHPTEKPLEYSRQSTEEPMMFRCPCLVSYLVHTHLSTIRNLQRFCDTLYVFLHSPAFDGLLSFVVVMSPCLHGFQLISYVKLLLYHPLYLAPHLLIPALRPTTKLYFADCFVVHYTVGGLLNYPVCFQTTRAGETSCYTLSHKK